MKLDLFHRQFGARSRAQTVQTEQNDARETLVLQKDQLSEVLIGCQEYRPSGEGLGKYG